MRKTLEGLVATVMGAVMGVLIAQGITEAFNLGPAVIWVGTSIGAFAGGSIAWVGTDFAKFCSGVRRAWKESIVPYWVAEVDYEQARKNAWALSFFGVFPALITGVFGLVVGLGFIGSLGWNTLEEVVEYVLFCTGITALTMVSFSAMGYVLGLFRIDVIEERDARAGYGEKDWGVLMFLLIPLAGVLSGILLPAVILAPFIILWMMRRAVGEFITSSYRYIHTYRRRCAFIGAFAGTVVGAMAGFSVIVAGLAGAGIFLLEYELVAKRILKTVSA